MSDEERVARIIEVLAATGLGVTTVTNDGVVSWVYTPPDADDPAAAAIDPQCTIDRDPA